MPGKRINELPSLSGAGSANDDSVLIFDTSTATTKRILRSQLAEGMVPDLPLQYYLGVRTSNPTLRLNGDPLQLGDYYLDSVTKYTTVYNGSGWNSYASIIAAQTAAEAARDAAQLAETNAETAETNAEAAQVLAEAARDAAQLAQTNAETAEANAEISAALARDRVVPAAFSWAGITPKICLAVGQAQASESVAEYAKRVHSTSIGSGVVYVDPVNGLDTNSGSVAAPVKTISYAVRTLAPSLVLCLPGEYSPFEFRNTDVPGNKLKIVKALGECIIKEAADDPAAATWTADVTYPNTWWMPLTPGNKPVLAVLDTSRVCEEGQPLPLVKETSIVNVNAMTNGVSYFHDTGANRLYVRYLGSVNLNTVKSRLKIITGDSASRILVYGSKLLFEGQWHLDGVTLMPLQNAGVRPYLYMDVQAESRPTVRHAISHGLDSLGADTYLRGAWLHRNKGDNFHYTDSGGLDCQGVEIDCKATFAGDKAGEPTAANTSNGSSMHLAGDVLRINGVYRRNWGPDIVDTGTGESWNVGTVSGPGAPSGNDFGIYTTGPVLRIDCCSSFSHAQADIAVTTGGVIKAFASSYRTTSNTGGTIEPYNPA